MASKKDKITKMLSEIGAGWAVRADRYTDPNDPYGARMRGEKTYHVHPDVSEPYQNAILRFRNLDEIADWIKARKLADDLSASDEYIAAENVMADYWASVER